MQGIGQAVKPPQAAGQQCGGPVIQLYQPLFELFLLSDPETEQGPGRKGNAVYQQKLLDRILGKLLLKKRVSQP